MSESGLSLSQYVVAVPAGERREVTFQTVVPDAVRDGSVQLRLVPQPRLEAVALEVRFRALDWRVDGATSWQGPWDRSLTLSWRVRR